MSTNLLHADDLTSRLLDLSQTSQEVPEPRFGDRLVGGEDGHAVDLRGGVGLGGQMAPEDLVLVKTTWRPCVSIAHPSIIPLNSKIVR